MNRPRPPDVRIAPTYPVLDTLRAVGALAVLTTHTTFQSGDYIRHGAVGTLLSRLDVGVAIFFVLSGFLLGRPYLARAARGMPRPSIGRYYWKRVLRIYPAYAVAAVIALAFIPLNDDEPALAWVRTLLMIDTYTADRLPHGLTQMWSLAVEVAFYVVLPLLMLVALGRSNALRSGRVVGVVVAMTAVSIWWHADLGSAVAEHSAGVPLSWLPGYLTWFGAGLALALVDVRRELGANSVFDRAVVSIGAMPGACWAVAGGLMLICATPLAGPALLFVATPGESLFKHLAYALVGVLIVATGVFAARDGSYARVMSLPAPRHLGHISYSIFCIHLPVLSLVVAITGYDLFLGHGLQIWALTLIISVAAAELLYRLVELPVMRWRNVGAGRTSDEPSNAATTNTTR